MPDQNLNFYCVSKSRYIVLAIILFVITGLLPQISLASQNPKAAHKFYVAPISGLNIRTKPSLQAPVLAKLDYNTEVNLVTDYQPTEPLQIKVSNFNSGFLTLEGHWVKVKAGKTTGYVFDAMLSRFKGIETSIIQDELYYAAIFGKPRKETIKKNTTVEGNYIEYETVITTYPKGMVEEYTFFDDCHEMTYTFTNPFHETYWFINRMLLRADAVQDVKLTKGEKETRLEFYSCT